LRPQSEWRDHSRGRDGRVNPNRPIPSGLLSIFWYLSSLKTRFCKVRFRKPALGKGFRGVAKKFDARSPGLPGPSDSGGLGQKIIFGV
jgi:hypothetical protein